jgi:hypothetical protein
MECSHRASLSSLCSSNVYALASLCTWNSIDKTQTSFPSSLNPGQTKPFFRCLSQKHVANMGNSNCLFRLSIANQQASSLTYMHVGILSLVMGTAPRVQQAPPPGNTLFINRSARDRCLHHMSLTFTAPLPIEPIRLTLLGSDRQVLCMCFLQAKYSRRSDWINLRYQTYARRIYGLL